MSLFNPNKSNYLKQIGLNASFSEAKRMFNNGEITKEEYHNLLKSFLSEYETINDSETSQALQLLITG